MSDVVVKGSRDFQKIQSNAYIVISNRHQTVIVVL